MSDQAASGILASRREERLRGGRGRGRSYDRVLDATERLLERSRLHDLSVEDILGEAEISRPTLYSYFASKQEIAAVLYERYMGELMGGLQPMYSRRAGEGPEPAIRRSVAHLMEVWAQHRAVFRTAHENLHCSLELQEMTARLTEVWVRPVADQIDRDRSAGVAPAGVAAPTLALSLLWSWESTLYLSGFGLPEDLSDDSTIADTLVTLWLGAVYATAPSL